MAIQGNGGLMSLAGARRYRTVAPVPSRPMTIAVRASHAFCVQGAKAMATRGSMTPVTATSPVPTPGSLEPANRTFLPTRRRHPATDGGCDGAVLTTPGARRERTPDRVGSQTAPGADWLARYTARA